MINNLKKKPIKRQIMKLERTLFKISISEIILLSIFMIVGLNGVIFLISLLTGKTRFMFYDTAWILQIVFPFVFAIIQTSINRNGVLKLTEYRDIETLTRQIESFFLKKGYIAIDSKIENVKYVKKTKFGRFLNHIFREDIKVKVAENGVEIFAKKNLLDLLRMKLKYDKTN